MLKPSALYPGSFDPITRGHEDLIARASKIFDLSIWVAVNPDKSGTFSLQERVRLIQWVVSKYKIPAYRVVRIPGSTSRWMQRNGIEKIIRGKRDAIDEIAENQLDHFNRLENPNLSTHMFKTDENLRFASSSAAKMLVKANHNPSSIITMNVQEALTSRILSQFQYTLLDEWGHENQQSLVHSWMNSEMLEFQQFILSSILLHMIFTHHWMIHIIEKFDRNFEIFLAMTSLLMKIWLIENFFETNLPEIISHNSMLL